MAARFSETDEIVNKQKNELKNTCNAKNTTKSQKTWVRAFDEWREAKSIGEKLHEMEPAVLNLRLEQFFYPVKEERW